MLKVLRNTSFMKQEEFFAKYDTRFPRNSRAFVQKNGDDEFGRRKCRCKGEGTPAVWQAICVGRGIAGGAVFNFRDNWLWLGLLGEDKRGGGIQTAAKGMEKEEDEGVRGECEGVIYP